MTSTAARQSSAARQSRRDANPRFSLGGQRTQTGTEEEEETVEGHAGPAVGCRAHAQQGDHGRHRQGHAGDEDQAGHRSADDSRGQGGLPDEAHGSEQETDAGGRGDTDPGGQGTGEQGDKHARQTDETEHEDGAGAQARGLQVGSERVVHGDEGEQQSGQRTGKQQDPRLGQQLAEVAELACQGGLAGACRFGEQDEDRQVEGEEDDAAAGEEPAPGALMGQGGGGDLAGDPGDEEGGGHGADGGGPVLRPGASARWPR